jgi:hypothetical protein
MKGFEMMENYRVVAIEPNKEPYEAEITLKAIHELIGEVIQQIPLYDDKFAVFNEYAKTLDLPTNRRIVLQSKGNIPITLRGNFIIVKLNAGEYEDLSDQEVSEARDLFQNPSGDAIFI